MSDWAKEKADLMVAYFQHDAVDIAKALRAARAKALEEAAIALAAEDERHAEIIVRALKDKA